MDKKTYITKLKALQFKINSILKMDTSVKESMRDTVKTMEKLKTGIEEAATETFKKGVDKDKKRFFIKTSQLYEEYLGANTSIGQVNNIINEMYKLKKEELYETGENIGKLAASIFVYIQLKKLWKKIDLFGKYAIDDVKNNISLAMNAKDYSQFLKYMKALKNIQEKRWFKIASYNNEAVKISDTFIESMKAGYIALGSALIITSLIMCLVLGLLTKPFSDIINAIKEKDIGLAIKGLAKIAGVGLLALPAILGIILIAVALTNFDDKSKAAEIIKKLGPINQQLSNTTLTIGLFTKQLFKKIEVSKA